MLLTIHSPENASFKVPVLEIPGSIHSINENNEKMEGRNIYNRRRENTTNNRDDGKHTNIVESRDIYCNYCCGQRPYNALYSPQILLAYKQSPLLQSFRAFVILASCIDVIVEAYMDPTGSSALFLLIDTVISFFFLLDLIMNLLTVPKVGKYLTSLYGIIDVISLIPLLLTIILII